MPGARCYPRPETKCLFPFMYPPSAAAMLAWISMLGRTGSLCAGDRQFRGLAGLDPAFRFGSPVKPGARRIPSVLILPSLTIVVLVHNIYLLGQPNLLLLALLPGAFVCLQRGHQFGAGALAATAAAIKAFPIMVLGYLVYRRLWAAAASTVVVLVAWLLIRPLPFRTPAQALDDVVVWSKGMLFTYNSYGIAQCPSGPAATRTNQSWRLRRRLLRNVPADGEAIVSRRLREAPSGPKSGEGHHALGPLNPPVYLPQAQLQGSPGSAHSKTALAGDSVPPGAGTADLKGGKEAQIGCPGGTMSWKSANRFFAMPGQ